MRADGRPLVDARWINGSHAVKTEPCPGWSVVVRDENDPARDRRIPCANEQERDQLMVALMMFGRPGLHVIGAFDP